MSCHVKAHGPWTWKLRNYFDPSNFNPDNPVPKVRLEGPFGGGNQDWYKHEIAIMVGGGIGVTPYASILNDLVFGTSTNRYSGVACKKVRFTNFSSILSNANDPFLNSSCKGLLPLDLPISPALRMVHRRTERR